MTMQYYMALVTVDNDKFTEASGKQFAHAITKLKATVENKGEVLFYRVTDVKAFEKFRDELKRLNKC